MQNTELKNKVKIFFKDWSVAIKKRWWLLIVEFLIIAVSLIADLLTKEYICKFLFTQPGMRFDLAPGFITLVYTENTGAGFGMFEGKTEALTAVTFIVVIALMVYLLFAQKESMPLRISLLLISAGGIGNIVDRIGLGYVRDFIKFAFWEEFAIFNIADSCVVVGAFMLIIVLIVMLIKEGRKNKKAFEEENASNIAATETESDPLDIVNLNPMLESKNDFIIEEQGADEGKQPSNDEDNNQ